ncbi:MAG TPA: Fic family protein [Longimicrobium sp.]|nr:Fic family protein [Longimicrobium sp.]
MTGGAGPTRKYLPAAPAPLDSAPTPEPSVREATAERDEEYVPVSPAGAELQALIRRPIGERQPAGYEREFLERYAPGKTWYLPRELRERLHRIGRTPDGERPAGTFARDIYGRLLIDLAWASSRLEGNTYTRLDTQNLIEFGQRAEGKDAEDAQMILNHKAAIELIVEDAEHVGFDRHTLLGLHSALSENLLGDPRDEGRLRNRPVLVTGTPFVPIAIPQVIEDCFALLLEKAGEIPDPFEQAFFAMVHIPYLQPFADVNKRTSRLAANIPLVKENLCPLSFVDVPERAYVEGTLAVYELTRVELLRDVFAWAYERSCARYKVVRDSMVQPDPLRLRYRNELAEVVRETVLALAPPRLESLRAAGQAQGVPAGDVPGFAERALELLLSLHEGNAGRYRLRPSEYSQWRSQFTGA